jgi:hypothetical protein
MTTCAFRGKGPFGPAAALASLPHWCVAALRRWQARWAAVLVLVVGVVLLGTSKARLDWADRSARIQRGPSVLAVVTASKVREADARAPHRDTDYTVTFTNPDGGRTETAVVTRAFVNDPNPLGASCRSRSTPPTLSGPRSPATRCTPERRSGGWL